MKTIKEIQEFIKSGVEHCTINPAGWSWLDYNQYVRFVLTREEGFDKKDDDGIFQIKGERICVGLRAVDNQYFVEDSEMLGDSCSLDAEDAKFGYRDIAKWLKSEASAYMKELNKVKRYCPKCGSRLLIPHWAVEGQLFCPDCCKYYDKV